MRQVDSKDRGRSCIHARRMSAFKGMTVSDSFGCCMQVRLKRGESLCSFFSGLCKLCMDSTEEVKGLAL